MNNAAVAKRRSVWDVLSGLLNAACAVWLLRLLYFVERDNEGLRAGQAESVLIIAFIGVAGAALRKWGLVEG